jgi:hypothetical protein
MPLLDVIDVLVRDSGQHLLTGPAHETDLAGLERALALPLPASFRTYLGRMGSGILYDRHEVFGPHSLQLHDIEFVPSLPGVLRQLRASLGPKLLPFHRGRGLVHVFDLGGGAQEPVPVRAMDGSASYPDLAAFLEAVVLPGPS